MATVTKKELIDRIADATGEKRVTVKKIVQSFLDNIVVELGQGNRLEFRDFGVFEIKHRAARWAQNPKTLERVYVPPKQTVKFKVGRMMREALASPEQQAPPGDGSHEADGASISISPQQPSAQGSSEPDGGSRSSAPSPRPTSSPSGEDA